MAELVVKLSQKLEPQSARTSEGEEQQQGTPGPNRDRLTVGVDLGVTGGATFLHFGFGRGETDGRSVNCAPHQRISRNSFRRWLQRGWSWKWGRIRAWVRDVVASCGQRGAEWLTRGRWKGRSGASARMIESMPISWRE